MPALAVGLPPAPAASGPAPGAAPTDGGAPDRFSRLLQDGAQQEAPARPAADGARRVEADGPHSQARPSRNAATDEEAGKEADPGAVQADAARSADASARLEDSPAGDGWPPPGLASLLDPAAAAPQASPAVGATPVPNAAIPATPVPDAALAASAADATTAIGADLPADPPMPGASASLATALSAAADQAAPAAAVAERAPETPPAGGQGRDAPAGPPGTAQGTDGRTPPALASVAAERLPTGAPANASNAPTVPAMPGGDAPGAAFALPAVAAPQVPTATPPAISAPHAPVPQLHGEAFADDIGTHVRWLAGQKIGHAHIRISPQELGPVEIRLQLDGERVSAHFASQQAEVRQALENSLPRLREMLGQHGFQLAHADVGQQQSPRQDGGRPAASESGPGQASTADGAVAPTALPTRRGLLDAYA